MLAPAATVTTLKELQEKANAPGQPEGKVGHGVDAPERGGAPTPQSDQARHDDHRLTSTLTTGPSSAIRSYCEYFCRNNA